jgi:hypothetical protein
MGIDPKDADKFLADMQREFETRKATRETMDFNAQDQVQLFQKFAQPQSFSFEEAVTREFATGNFDQKTNDAIVTLGSIRSNFIEFKNTFLNPDNITKPIEPIEKNPDAWKDYELEIADNNKAIEWVDSFVRMVGNDIIIMATTSKGKGGWLGNLIISSKRSAEVITGSVQNTGKKLFGLR